MLIYARKQPAPPGSSLSFEGSDSPDEDSGVPEPPQRAMEVIEQHNAVHDEACEVYAQKERQIKLSFEDLRSKVMYVYRTWNVSSSTEVRTDRFAIRYSGTDGGS